MARIPVSEAAAHGGVSVNDIETWANLGLLRIHGEGKEPAVDADQFRDLMENFGWLRISAQNWDDAEND